ncbi:hypothetical protein [Limnoglobus roseus]|uniref:Uncharacterized protein n=1 Tax=Limnoglobus roseus TaxID=2598579 RepID=A0A5C1AC60_9BACT|nr:hypothetical protein [Limnoglobus roseus]QEL15626.1 hypothetical protein PX52LOC_02559 [Limnoglobus roseus]
MNTDITADDVRKLRMAFLAAGPCLDLLTRAAKDGELPDQQRWVKAGERLARDPGLLEVRLIAKATRRTPAGVVRYFRPLNLALLASLAYATLPGLFPDPAVQLDRVAPFDISRWILNPPRPSCN